VSNRIELTPRLKWLVSGVLIAVCGLLAYFAGDLIGNIPAKNTGIMVFSLGVIIACATWIRGLAK
jgi:drug/metabolite transporter (DMT)-like permease